MENSNSKSWFSGWLGLLEFVFGDGAGTVLFAKLLSMGVMVGASAAVAAGDLVTDAVDGEVDHEGGYGDGDTDKEDEGEALAGGLHNESDDLGEVAVQIDLGNLSRRRRRLRFGGVSMLRGNH